MGVWLLHDASLSSLLSHVAVSSSAGLLECLADMGGGAIDRARAQKFFAARACPASYEGEAMGDIGTSSSTRACLASCDVGTSSSVRARTPASYEREAMDDVGTSSSARACTPSSDWQLSGVGTSWSSVCVSSNGEGRIRTSKAHLVVWCSTKCKQGARLVPVSARHSSRTEPLTATLLWE